MRKHEKLNIEFLYLACACKKMQFYWFFDDISDTHQSFKILNLVLSRFQDPKYVQYVLALAEIFTGEYQERNPFLDCDNEFHHTGGKYFSNMTRYQRGQCILFSVVFISPSPSHHGSVWFLPILLSVN